MYKNILLLGALLINQPTFSSGFWSPHFFNVEFSERTTFKMVYSGCLGGIENTAYCSGLLALHRFFLLTASNWHHKTSPLIVNSWKPAFPTEFSRGQISYLNDHFNQFKNSKNYNFAKEPSAEKLAELGSTILNDFQSLKSLRNEWKKQHGKKGTYKKLISTAYDNSEEVLEAIKNRLKAKQLVIAAQRPPLLGDPLVRMSARVPAYQLPFIIIYGYKEPNLSLSMSLYSEEDATFYYLSTAYNPISKIKIRSSEIYQGFASEKDLIRTMNLGYTFRKEPDSFKIISFEENTLEDIDEEVLPELGKIKSIEPAGESVAHKNTEDDDLKNTPEEKSVANKDEASSALEHLKESAKSIMFNFIAQHDNYLENMWPREKVYSKYQETRTGKNDHDLLSMESSSLERLNDALNDFDDDNQEYSLDFFTEFFNQFFKNNIDQLPKHKDFVEYNKNIEFGNRDLNLEVQSIKKYELAKSTINKLLLNNQPVITIKCKPKTTNKEYILIKEFYTRSEYGKLQEYYSYINGRDGQFYEMQAIFLLRQIKDVKEQKIDFVTWNRQLPDTEKESPKTDLPEVVFEDSSIPLTDTQENTPPPSKYRDNDSNESLTPVLTPETPTSFSPIIRSIDGTESKKPESSWWDYIEWAQKKLSSFAHWFLSFIPGSIRHI